eukprot:5972233-Ditylum_brightwellii.AAC.1
MSLVSDRADKEESIFIHHLTTFTNTLVQWIIIGSADNKGLIKWTMEPIPKVSHVKGHQNDDTPYKELDWTSQQNIDADKLADVFLEQHAAQRVQVPCVQ